MAPLKQKPAVIAASTRATIRPVIACPITDPDRVTNPTYPSKPPDCLNGSGIEYFAARAFHGTGLTNAHHQAFERAASRRRSENRSEQGADRLRAATRLRYAIPPRGNRGRAASFRAGEEAIRCMDRGAVWHALCGDRRRARRQRTGGARRRQDRAWAH